MNQILKLLPTLEDCVSCQTSCKGQVAGHELLFRKSRASIGPDGTTAVSVS